MAEIIDKQLDYSIIDQYSFPSHKLTKVLPLTSNSRDMSISGGEEILLEVPNVAGNLCESEIEFDIKYPQTAGAYNWIRVDTLSMFQQVQFGNKLSQQIVDLQHVAQYLEIVSKVENRLDDIKFRDTFHNSTTVCEYLRTSNSLASDNMRQIQNTGTGGNFQSDIHYDEVLYYKVSGLAADMTLHCRFKLGAFKNTILSVNKDLVWDEIMVLRFVLAPRKQVAFVSDSNTAVVNPVAYDGVVELRNIIMYYATEQNKAIEASLRARKNSSGIRLLVPYVWAGKQNIPSGGTQSLSIPFRRTHGMTLQKLYLVPYNPTESAEGIFDHHEFDSTGVPGGQNGTVSKIKSFYTSIDQERLHQDFNIELNKQHDYCLLKKRFKGSLILNSNIYYYNWFWVDDFTAPKSLDEKSDKDMNAIQGLDLSVERKWDFVAETRNASITYYTFAICQRPMLINKDGIFWE